MKSVLLRIMAVAAVGVIGMYTVAAGQNKVIICHCGPGGSCETIEVAAPAGIAHLAHDAGDYVGACRVDAPDGPID